MFSDVLNTLISSVPGAMAATVMGFDGIAIESKEKSADFDWQSATIELGNIASQLKRISASVDGGEVETLTVTAEKFTTLLRPLTEEYFVALTLGATGYAGKGRYMLRVHGPKIAAELA